MPLVTTLVKNSPNWPPKLLQSDTRRNRDEPLSLHMRTRMGVHGISTASPCGQIV
jgi:hypothetical protein